MKPGVTLSMIVRNESANLRRCLESAAEFMDCIQIVDTGSTDDTIEVAEEFGAEVFEIEWPNAFDVARNFGFDQVKTQWTFWLDADEWLMPDAGSIIRQVVKLWEASAYFITRLDYRADGGHMPVQLVRLWRTHPEMRVHGMLHENFRAESLATLEASRPILLAPIYVGHDGYIDPLNPEKMQRNISMLERQLNERPYTFYHDAHLHYGYFGLGDPRGLEGFRRLSDDVIATWPERRNENMAPLVMGLTLSHMSKEEITLDRARNYVAMIRENFPFEPAAMWEAYRTLMRQDREQEAIEVLREIQRRGRTGDYAKFNAFNPDLFAVVDQLLEKVRAGEKLEGPRD